MKQLTVVLLLLLATSIFTGCATKRVMKNCIQMGADELKEFSVCEDQYKIWR